MKIKERSFILQKHSFISEPDALPRIGCKQIPILHIN
jgi:hypothetical protein